MKLVNLVIGLLIITLQGCSTSVPDNQQQRTNYNDKYATTHHVVVKNDVLHVELTNSNGETVYSFPLPNSEAISQQYARQLQCLKNSSWCVDERNSEQYISWSPDGEFLAILSGNFEGLCFVPTNKLVDGTLTYSDILKVKIVNATQRRTVGLFHKMGGWINDHQYIFTAGLNDSNLAYRFDAQQLALSGFPFQLSGDSTVNTFNKINVDDFRSHASTINITSIGSQLAQLE